MSEQLRLFHAGAEPIPEPDVRRGRVNADFGQGFYTTDSEAFALRWGRETKEGRPVVSTYELDTAGLSVLYLDRDEAWFAYLSANRRALPDAHPEADVVIGPVANDTIYDTLGIMTSGFLTDEESLALLRIGPQYRQVVIKSEKAAAQLRFAGSREMTPEETAEAGRLREEEEEAYRTAFGKALEEMA